MAVVDDRTAGEMDGAWLDHTVGALMERSAQRQRDEADRRRAEALASGRVECPPCGKFLRSERGLEAALDAVHSDAPN